jgi:FixJ family two-component response regulator
MRSFSSARRVCIVDDEVGVRELLELVCASACLPCASFDSAEAFLAACCANAPECALLLLDIDLPGISGLDLLATLGAQGFRAPVVVISGALDSAKLARARALGAVEVLGKPFDVHALRQRIRAMVGQPG